ncbi:hypothetical protein Enr8_51150 [Blastopirellula retiformator]|uniref:Hint domain-containing protein n=1 Tax=Blastopirellula retiformator TaxID=2527970 RepID=A0A5C5UUU0_9BACT|nr:hypothetical protein Enr8_51150 [Blastopirellula retiformator]
MGAITKAKQFRVFVNAVNKSDYVAKGVKALRASPVDEAFSTLRKACFSRDTLVSTELGLRSIGEIRPGERVHSFDFEAGEWKLRTVTDRIDSIYEGAVLTIETGDSEIETTIHHPFWVIRGHELSKRSTPRLLSAGEDEGPVFPGRWVNSHELQAGDVITGRDGRPQIIRQIHQRYEESFPVSNLTIGDFHNYAVGVDSILVHNESLCDDGIERLNELVNQGAVRLEDAEYYALSFDNADEILKKLDDFRAPTRVTGETASTATGKSVHKALADARRAGGDFDLVQTAIKDKAGNPILVSKRVNLKTGLPQPGARLQEAIPDAVNFRRKLILDDKPLGRPIAKDRQEIIRFIEAYRRREGHLPDVIGIQRYDPKTGQPILTELYLPNDFLP